MSNKIAIFTQSYLTAIPSNFAADEMVFNLTSKIEQLVASEFLEVEWQSTQFGIYEPNIDNLGKCQKCGCWTTDKEADNPINEVSHGAKVNGQLLCDECLPKDHPLAF